MPEEVRLRDRRKLPKYLSGAPLAPPKFWAKGSTTSTNEVGGSALFISDAVLFGAVLQMRRSTLQQSARSD